MITSSPQGAPSGPTYRTPPSSAPSRAQQQVRQPSAPERPGLGEATGDFVVEVATDQGQRLVQEEITRAVFGEASRGASEAAATEAGMQAGEAAAESQGISLGDVTTAIAWARQAYQAYQVLSDGNLTDEEKAVALGKMVGLAVADFYTFGLASLAYGTIGQTKEFQKLEKELQPYDQAYQGLSSVGRLWGGGNDFSDWLSAGTMGQSAVMSNVIHDLTGFDGPGVRRKTTKEYQAERTKDLFDTTEDPFVQRSIAQLRGMGTDEPVTEHAPGDLTTARPEQVWGSEGILKTFGPEYWLKELTEPERRAATQAIISAGLLRHDKGDIVIPDELQEQAREIGQAAIAKVTEEEKSAWHMEAASRPSPFTGQLSDEAIASRIAEQSGRSAPRITSSPQGAYVPQGQPQQASVDYGSRAEMESAYTPQQPQPQQPSRPRITSAPQGAFQ